MSKLPRLTLAFAVIAAGSFPTFSRVDASSWNPAATPLDRAHVHDAALAPTQPDRIFAVSKSVALYRSDNRGTSWSDLSQTLPPDRIVTTVTVSPFDSDVVLLGGEQRDPSAAIVFRSTDGGESWTQSSAGLGGERVSILAFHPSDPMTVLAGTYSGTDPGVFRSTDGGLSWSLQTSMLGPIPAYQLVIDPFDPDVLVAITTSAYIRSTNGGSTWTTHPTVENFFSLSASPLVPGLYYASSTNQVFKSTDSGASFSPIAAPDGFVFYPVVADPTLNAGLFVSSRDFCGGFDGAVWWRSSDGGATWSEMFRASEPDCGEWVSAILPDPADPSTIVVTTEGKNGIFRTLDGGSHWTVQNEGFHVYSVQWLRQDGGGHVYGRGFDVLLAADTPEGIWTSRPVEFDSDVYGFEPSPAASELLYESGTGYEWDLGIDYARVSDNGGSTWDPPLGYMPDGLGQYPRNIAPAWNDETVYVFGWDGTYRSDDVGSSYVRTGDDIVLDAAAVDPTNPARLYAARRYDPVVIYSTDSGASWSPRAAGLPNKACVHLEIDPIDPLHLGAVFTQSGAWETTDGGVTWANVLPFGGNLNDADWDPAAGHFYLATLGSGIVTNDARVQEEGLVTVSPYAVALVDQRETLLMSTPNGIYYQTLSTTSAEEPELAHGMFQITVSPNPMREEVSIDLASAGAMAPGTQVAVQVLDVNGRLVRSIESVTEGGSTLRTTWDSRDDDGRLVPAGVYLVRVAVSNATAGHGTQRVIVMR